MALEIISIIAGVPAVVGVVLNNHRLIWCFPIWAVSNALTLIVHVQCGVVGLIVRDAVFLALAFHGWWKWNEKSI